MWEGLRLGIRPTAFGILGLRTLSGLCLGLEELYGHEFGMTDAGTLRGPSVYVGSYYRPQAYGGRILNLRHH